MTVRPLLFYFLVMVSCLGCVASRAFGQPEEILFQLELGAVNSYRPNGVRGNVSGVHIDHRALAFDRRGSLYVGGGSIFPTVNGFLWGVWAADDGLYGSSWKGDSIKGYEGSLVTGLACNKAGTLFVAEAKPVAQISRVDPGGSRTPWITTVLQAPGALAIDSAGNLYVADNGAQTVFKFTPTGAVSVLLDNQPEISALLFDKEDNLLVAYPTYGLAMKYTFQGGAFAVAAGLKQPRSLAYDKAGNLFVGDEDYHFGTNEFGGSTSFGGWIYKFAPDGTKTVFAETGGAPLGLAFRPHPPVLAMNISTRSSVETGENVLIGGFIVSGPGPKKIIVRGIGPTLSSFGITGALANPVLELHDNAGHVIAANDDWQTPYDHWIEGSGLAPSHTREAAIVITLNEGTYTAVLSGKDGATGVGLLEIYDLQTTYPARLANISTRSRVKTLDDVLIGGFILGAGAADSTVVVRALGPSLADAGIADSLPDPVLELHDKNGATVQVNDDWAESEQAHLKALNLAPNKPQESGLIATLAAGNYTAVVRGKNGAVGIGLVEVYHLGGN